jgi:hypothetical protein
MKKTQSRTFHLHIDATLMPEALYQALKSQFGFWDSEFKGHPKGYSHFEPNRHVTLKFTEGGKFRKACGDVEALVEQYPDFVGYLEGEYIREERFVADAPYRERPVPFKISRRRLDGSPFEQFRESELHLSLDKDASCPLLIKTLLDAGLYGAYLPKADYVALILTIQGFREDIGGLTECIWDYLAQSGGTVKAKLKEEFAIWHKLYGLQPKDLPEIIDKVEYFE